MKCPIIIGVMGEYLSRKCKFIEKNPNMLFIVFIFLYGKRGFCPI
uniref:Uncharacterized protein n=1 Tax=Bartonella schoenbuchensis (strain DSM 13525 / NCTC 13165 / R1) TaxID=687861 RepID=E6Z0B6_BARSR|nr:hypothetical protein B11C_40409 [Bartonella schoenbuchensis R1]